MKLAPSLGNIREAKARIAPHVHRTPVLTCRTLDRMTGAEVFFKCENLQKAGAFKARGAVNAVFSLSHEEALRGVATHSSGNHAGALSYAAGIRGIPAHIVMPHTAPKVKVAAVEGYGGQITFCEPTVAARQAAAHEVVARTGAVLIHPYDDDRIIAGAATAALELLEDVPGLDVILAPVGGGGLLSGTALVTHYLSPGTRVYGGEPEAANDAARSLRVGHIVQNEKSPETIADGLRTNLSERTFAIISNHVEDILTVSEDEILSALRLVWERMKIMIEPSSAVPVAALLKNSGVFAGMRVGVILSGGNADVALRGKG